jgi:hypothetical protein
MSRFYHACLMALALILTPFTSALAQGGEQVPSPVASRDAPFSIHQVVITSDYTLEQTVDPSTAAQSVYDVVITKGKLIVYRSRIWALDGLTAPTSSQDDVGGIYVALTKHGDDVNIDARGWEQSPNGHGARIDRRLASGTVHLPDSGYASFTQGDLTLTVRRVDSEASKQATTSRTASVR